MNPPITHERTKPAALRLGGIVASALLLAASTSSGLAQVPLGSQQVISTDANGAESVFAIDLDRDGDADVLSASFNDDKIAWYENRLGEASADFGAQQVISTDADSPRSVFAIDLDRDGDADVLSASITDDKIAWYENRLDEASADFGSQQVISTDAASGRPVFAIDLDRDGDADVLSVSGADDEIVWHENRLDEASADFGPQQVISTDADGPRSVFAIDLDGDGDADVLSASLLDNTIAWYENRLDETSADFGSQQVISTAAQFAESVFAIDLDRDGDADVLSASSIDNKIAWYENRLDEASADFGSQQVISTVASGAESVFAIDLDRDGDADVLSASQYDDKIAWYENRLVEVSADFGPQQVLSTSADGGSSVFAIDLDKDGDADVLSASTLDNKIAWYENRLIHNTAGHSVAHGHAEVAFPRSVAAGDVDRDGDVDLFLVRAKGLELYRNPGAGDFFVQSTISTSPFGNLEALDPADLDRDGDLDLLVAGAAFATGIFWYENATGDGSGTWPNATITTTSALDVQAADLDDDGDLDALVASNEIAWHENRLDEPSADFGTAQTISTVVITPRSVFAADLDRDGDLDVLSASSGDDKIAWYENTGGGNFQPQQIIITTAADNASSVFAADVDGDGDLDVLSASQDDDTIAWYANDGTGVFSTPMTITTTADQARSVRADDLDLDGDADVVVMSGNGGSWYENMSGDGSSWAETAFLVTSGSHDAIIAKLNSDSAPDIAYVGTPLVDNRMWIVYNQLGQFTTRGTETAQGVVSNGQLEDVLAIEVEHLGRAGDTDVELTSLEIRLADSSGLQLASAQANALIDTLRLYRDDGSGEFEESSDLLVTTLSSFSLVGGYQTIPVVDDDPNAAVAFGSPATFFVTLEMTTNAEEHPITRFRVSHQGETDEAEDASADSSLARDPRRTFTEVFVNTDLTDATCHAPFDLNLENRTIDTALTCEAGTELRFGSSTVTASAILTLRAGSAVELEEAAEVTGGLAIEIDPALLP